MAQAYFSFLGAKHCIIEGHGACMQGMGGVVTFHICVDKIIKERGGSVHYLKYSQKLQDLDNLDLNKTCIHKYEFYHPSSLYLLSLAYAHLPHHSKKFCAKKRRLCFGHLGVINLWEKLTESTINFLVIYPVVICRFFQV